MKHVFDNVIGQATAKQRLSYLLSGAANGEETKSVIMTGETGLGKSHLSKALAEGFKGLGWKVHDFADPSEMTGKVFSGLAEDIGSEGLPVLVKIGETHRLKTEKRVQLGRMHKFIMSFTDETRKGKTININDGELTAKVDWTRLVFILDTNFPDKLEEGKQSTSFRDRLLQVKLENYTPDELTAILSKMIAAKNLRIHDSTVKLIVDCARGTARPMANICDELVAMNNATSDKKTMNREEVIEAIRLAKLYPLGLSHEEVAMLQDCQKTKRLIVLQQYYTSMSSTGIRQSLSFLQRKDFVTQPSSGFVTTTRGLTYLKSIERDGFKLPRQEN